MTLCNNLHVITTDIISWLIKNAGCALTRPRVLWSGVLTLMRRRTPGELLASGRSPIALGTPSTTNPAGSKVAAFELGSSRKMSRRLKRHVTRTPLAMPSKRGRR
eukprot:IDg6310t1